MTLLERYLNYLSQICEGSRTPPEGILLTRTGDMEKAIELQQQIAGLGIPEFVKRCAAQDGEEIPEQELESFDASQMLSALTQMDAGEALPAQEAPAEGKAQNSRPRKKHSLSRSKPKSAISMRCSWTACVWKTTCFPI